MAQTNSMRYTGIPPVTGVRIVHLFFLYPDHAVSPAVPTLPGTEADDPVGWPSNTLNLKWRRTALSSLCRHRAHAMRITALNTELSTIVIPTRLAQPEGGWSRWFSSARSLKNFFDVRTVEYVLSLRKTPEADVA